MKGGTINADWEKRNHLINEQCLGKLAISTEKNGKIICLYPTIQKNKYEVSLRLKCEKNNF